MSEVQEFDPIIMQFCDRLSRLDTGDRGRLKRCAGKTMTEARSEALALFFNALPYEVPGYQQGTYFLVASLFPFAESTSSGDLGSALRRVKTSSNAKGLDRRVQILLDSDETQLPHRLRQVIYLMQSTGVGVCWPQLLEDLLRWTHPNRYVQRHWAQSYFTH